jgi:hypothetical protein
MDAYGWLMKITRWGDSLVMQLTVGKVMMEEGRWRDEVELDGKEEKEHRGRGQNGHCTSRLWLDFQKSRFLFSLLRAAPLFVINELVFYSFSS